MRHVQYDHELIVDVIDILERNVHSDYVRQKIFRELITVFEEYDYPTDCAIGESVEYDKAYTENHPESEY